MDLIVTGTLSPDATGTYSENGTYNGQPAYERADGAYWIWFLPGDFWLITIGKGNANQGWYTSPPITGSYTAFGIGVTGTATVAVAPVTAPVSGGITINHGTVPSYENNPAVMSAEILCGDRLAGCLTCRDRLTGEIEIEERLTACLKITGA